MAEIPARLLWLNGPHHVGKRDLAAWLRDEWQVAVLDPEAINATVLDGLPARLNHRHPETCSPVPWPIWQLAVDMAYRYGLVVVPATVHRPDTVAELLAQLGASVDVLHLLLTADETTLGARIHQQDLDPDTKRQALAHLRPTIDDLNEIPDAIRIDTTGRTPTQIAAPLIDALVHYGWLTPARTWTTAPPQS